MTEVLGADLPVPAAGLEGKTSPLEPGRRRSQLTNGGESRSWRGIWRKPPHQK